MEAKMEGQRLPQANAGNKLEKQEKRYKQPWVLHFISAASGHYGLYIFIYSDVRYSNGLSGLQARAGLQWFGVGGAEAFRVYVDQ